MGGRPVSRLGSAAMIKEVRGKRRPFQLWVLVWGDDAGASGEVVMIGQFRKRKQAEYARAAWLLECFERSEAAKRCE